VCEDALTYARDGHCGELGKTTDPAEIPGVGRRSKRVCCRSACMNATPQPGGSHQRDFPALTERLMVLGFVRIDQLKQITCASAIRLVPEVTVASPQIP
jgi:hypothetical protein